MQKSTWYNSTSNHDFRKNSQQNRNRKKLAQLDKEHLQKNQYLTSCLIISIVILRPSEKWSLSAGILPRRPQTYPVLSSLKFSHSVQSLSRVRLFVTLWTAARQASHHQLLKLVQTRVHRIGDAIQPSHPQSSPFPAFNLSSIRGFSSESVLWLHQVAKVLKFQPQHQSFQWIYRTDFL